MPARAVICTGMIDRIGLDTSNISYKTNADSIEESMSIANHKIGLEKIAALLMDRNTGVINSTQDIDVVGHRVVHGGASFSNPFDVDEEKITQLSSWHRSQSSELGRNSRRFIFTSAKQMAVLTLLSSNNSCNRP
jgi:acetate kinase